MASITRGLLMAAIYPSRCSLNLTASTLRDTSEASTSRRSTGSAAKAAVVRTKVAASTANRRRTTRMLSPYARKKPRRNTFQKKACGFEIGA